MIPTQNNGSAIDRGNPDLLNQDSLNEICTAPGPWITIFLPAFHPGALDLPGAERLRTMLRDAELELNRRRFAGSNERFLKPLKDLSTSPSSLAGGASSAIFLSPGTFRHLRLPAPTGERLVAASHPYITPLLEHLLPRVSYVLSVSKKLTRLGRWRGGAFTEISLPVGVPNSFEEDLVFDQPDHDLQNRAASASASQVGPARFGTGSERDLVHDRLRRYFQRLDREIAGILRDAPLVLVGVAEELVAYRSAAGNRQILTAKPTNPDHLNLEELRELCEEALLAARREEAEKVLSQIRETSRRDLVTSGIREVLEAAREGRIHKLLVQKDTECQGLLGPLFPVDDTSVEGDQDLINAAVVETIRAGGEVFVGNQVELGDRSIAALLRYSETAR